MYAWRGGEGLIQMHVLAYRGLLIMYARIGNGACDKSIIICLLLAFK